MSKFLIFAFLFSMGCVLGWILEVFYRKFFSGNNPEHKWINPGFLTGPYLPLYGFSLVGLYLLASLEGKLNIIKNPTVEKLVLFLIMAVCMTVIEYIAGIMSIKIAHVRLWDYSKQWGNIQGIICPLFSLFWAALGALYYFLVHPRILNALEWLSSNLAFSFFIGAFYGVFVLDLVKTTGVMVTIRKFADENQIVVHYDELKERIRQHNNSMKIHARFLYDLKTDIPLKDVLKDYYEHLTEKMPKPDLKQEMKNMVENIKEHVQDK